MADLNIYPAEMAILTQTEISAFFKRYDDVCQFIDDINVGHLGDRKIKQVQLPFNLSESLVFHHIVANPALIEEEQINHLLLVQGNSRTFDFTYDNRIRIEVKATGSDVFQRFRPRALTADFVFWLNFTGNRMYNLAKFSPRILTPRARASGEADIRWNQLLQLADVEVTENLTV